MRLHPVILAGGRGERFWPLSRRGRPKQLLPLLSDRPMLADTLARLHGAARPADTFILTARDLAGAVRLAAPDVPHHHIVGEPVEVIARVKSYAAMGYDEFAIWIDSGVSFARKKASLERFIANVMPAFGG